MSEFHRVTTGNFNKAVSRNKKRFPKDFMFILAKDEFDNLIFQNGISSWGGTRKMPKVFTEQGVAMLSGVLNSDRAIAVHIQIIRIFTKKRSLLLTQKDLMLKLKEIEKRVGTQDDKIERVFDYLRQFVKENEEPKTPIGFRQRSIP